MSTTNYANLEVGTEVYYTGDMANVDGVGKITTVEGPDRWQSRWYTVKLDDGREMRGVMPSNFGHPEKLRGERFQVLSERKAWQAERFAALRASLGR